MKQKYGSISILLLYEVWNLLDKSRFFTSTPLFSSALQLFLHKKRRPIPGSATFSCMNVDYP